LSYLHEQRIVHRDVKAENVLLCEGLICKLTDFGLSKQQMESSFGGQSTHHGGTLSFLAPETLPPHGRYSHRSDVYSCGVTCHQILRRSSPHLNHSQMISHLKLSMDCESWQKLVEGSLAPDVGHRLSSRDCLELIREVQSSSLIGGNPRGSRTHVNCGEVQVLKSILTLGRSNESQLDRSHNEVRFPHPPPPTPMLALLCVSLSRLGSLLLPLHDVSLWESSCLRSIGLDLRRQ
jgi:serine/threonine protein kinase